MQSANHGDVIKANHPLHAHYGVYVKTPRGPRVIHYTNAESRSRLKGPVSETSVEDFLDGAEGFKVCRFDPARYPRLHSGEETVRRARSQLGKDDYNFFWNNCEHFAAWCKTGEAVSSQVSDLSTGFLGNVFSFLDDLLSNPFGA